MGSNTPMICDWSSPVNTDRARQTPETREWRDTDPTREYEDARTHGAHSS